MNAKNTRDEKVDINKKYKFEIFQIVVNFTIDKKCVCFFVYLLSKKLHLFE